MAGVLVDQGGVVEKGGPVAGHGRGPVATGRRGKLAGAVEGAGVPASGGLRAGVVDDRGRLLRWGIGSVCGGGSKKVIEAGTVAVDEPSPGSWEASGTCIRCNNALFCRPKRNYRYLSVLPKNTATQGVRPSVTARECPTGQPEPKIRAMHTREHWRQFWPLLRSCLL